MCSSTRRRSIACCSSKTSIAPEDQPRRPSSFRAHLAKGRPTIHIINDVPGPSNSPRSGRHGSRPFISLKDGRIPWQMKLTDEQGRPRYPFLILDSVLVFAGRSSPIEERQPPRRTMQREDRGDPAQVREAFGKLATQAVPSAADAGRTRPPTSASCRRNSRPVKSSPMR